MRIKLFRSSTIGIHFDNFKILQDPWLVDGEYYGSWSHYPSFDIKLNISEINSYNAIFISHIHPDHCSEKTLAYINKNIPVYIAKFHAKFLKFKLERLGFKVYEIDNGTRTKIFDKIYINIYAADDCDPVLCYKFTGCAKLNIKNESQQIDSLCVIDDGKNVLVNLNDCPYELSKNLTKKILSYYNKIDILLTNYCGAGPFPQCFDNLNNNQKIIEGEKKKFFFLNQGLAYIKDFNPKFYLPFAWTYSLTGKMSALQDLRGVPLIDEAYNFFERNLINKNNKPIKINTDSIFDLDTEEISREYKPLNIEEYSDYLKNNLALRHLDYENEVIPNDEELYQLAKKAFTRYMEKKTESNIIFSTNIYLDLGKSLIEINNTKSQEKIDLIKNEKFKLNSNFVKYSTDKRLLKSLLMGPKFAHWNNAEIGSHISFLRNPNIFERQLYENMCYFHA